MEFLTDLSHWLAREETRFWLSWGGLALTFIISVTLAIAQLGIIRRFDEAALIKQQRGRKAQKPDTIRRHIREFESYAENAIRLAAIRTGFVLMFGVAIPGALLAVLVIYQDWLMPGTALLLDAPASGAGPQTLIGFVLDQAMRGGLSDAFEVFDLSLSPVRNNPDNVIFSWLILGYRIIAGVIFAVIPFLLIQIARGAGALAGAIGQLKHDLAAAEAG
ncbi:hypothetical protein [uncultured Maricaulis sp.]|uniref:hypothetical protein n=1 Tax=uncultured Maricaulis sp. TaxID=174710 RepID=UPI0030DB5F7A|tara:strand:+ start:84528 stop:85184 length:657 start_codon:yes stop_codon:yes gene_type:complete